MKKREWIDEEKAARLAKLKTESVAEFKARGGSVKKVAYQPPEEEMVWDAKHFGAKKHQGSAFKKR